MTLLGEPSTSKVSAYSPIQRGFDRTGGVERQGKASGRSVRRSVRKKVPGSWFPGRRRGPGGVEKEKLEGFRLKSFMWGWEFHVGMQDYGAGDVGCSAGDCGCSCRHGKDGTTAPRSRTSGAVLVVAAGLAVVEQPQNWEPNNGDAHRSHFRCWHVLVAGTGSSADSSRSN